MANPEPAEKARIDYRVGAEFDSGHGRFELVVSADGTAALGHRHRGIHRSFSARLDPVVWPRLVEALRASRFPEMPAIRTRGTVQELAVAGLEPAGEVWMRRGSGDEVGLTDALRILDSVAHQMSAVPGADTLPRIVSGVTAGVGEQPVPAEVAATGAVGLRAVAGVVRVDGSVSVLGLPDGTTVTEIPPTGSPPRCVTFGDLGPDGEPQPVVVTGSDDGLIRLWGPDGAPLTRQVRHTGPVTAVTTTIADDGLLIWTGDLAGNLLQRELQPTRPVLAWPGAPVGITALGWAGTADYRMLVLATDDGRVARRSLDAPGEIEVWPAHSGPVNAIALMGVDDDFLIASAGADRVIRLRAGLSGKPAPDLPGHDATVTGVAFGVIGDRLVLGSTAFDGTVCTWDVETREPLARWSAGDDWPAALADARTDGVQRWATGGADGVVRIWDAATGDPVHALAEPDGPAAAVLCVATALLPGTTLVGAGHQDGTFRVWNAATGALLGVDRSTTEPLTSVEFGRDRQFDVFVGGTLAGSVRVYDPSNGRLARVLSPHTDQVLSVALGTGSDDTPVIVSGGADHTMRVWAARTGWPLAVLSGHTDLVTAVAVAPGLVVSGGYDRTVRLSTLDGTPVWVRRFPTTVYAVTAGADAVVAGGLDDSVRVLTLADGREQAVTDPVEGLVTGVAVGVWRGLPVVAAVGTGQVFCWTRVSAAPVPVIQPAWPVLAVTLTAAGELVAVGVRGVTVVEPRRVHRHEQGWGP